MTTDPEDIKRLLAPAKTAVPMPDDILEIDPKAAVIEPVETPKGTVWRLISRMATPWISASASLKAGRSSGWK